jgi:hypothetical protein
MKVTEVVQFPLFVPLQAIRLELLEQPAERTTRLVEGRKYRMVDHMLLMPSHEIASAIRTPHQTATRPRKKLASAYNDAMKNAPVRMDENVSHSYVENVLYAPTKPMGIRYRQAGSSSVRLPRKVRAKPMITQAVMLMTKVP